MHSQLAHYVDLTTCDYFPEHDERLIAVGWLSRGHDFSRGEVSADLFARIHQLLVDPWSPALSAGAHACEFCRFSAGPRKFTLDNTTASLGVSNLFVPTADRLYVAPSLILHYIDAHEYSPPDEFCDAVMSCPEMRSIDYLKQIRKTASSKFLIAN